MRVVVALAALLPSVALGEEPGAQAKATRTWEALDRKHQALGTMLEDILRRTDALFSGEKNQDAPTGSYVALGARTRLPLTSNADGSTGLLGRAKIRLPNTQERLQILIGQDVERIGTTQAQKDAEEAAGIRERSDNPFVALRGIARETLKLQLTADAGLRFDGIEPDPFVRGRARRLFEPGEWILSLSETLLWQRSEAFTANTEFGVYRALGKKHALSMETQAEWRDKTDGFDLAQTLTLSWRINERSLGALELGAFAETQPRFEATAYSIAARYRRKVYSDWLLVELRPQVTFPRDNDYDTTVTFTLQFEAYFGSNYLNNL
jgi:hypothetical protein